MRKNQPKHLSTGFIDRSSSGIHRQINQRVSSSRHSGEPSRYSLNPPNSKNIKGYRRLRQTQAGIGHSAPEDRGRRLQNRSRCGEQRQGRNSTEPHAEHPRASEWTGDQAGRRRLANTDVDGGSRVHSTAALHARQM